MTPLPESRATARRREEMSLESSTYGRVTQGSTNHLACLESPISNLCRRVLFVLKNNTFSMKWSRPLSWIVLDDLVEISVLAVALLRRRVRVRGRLPLASLPWRRPLRPIQIRVEGVLRVLRLSGSRVARAPSSASFLLSPNAPS